MKVYKKCFFHISKDNNWNIGDIITAGADENPFWKVCKDLVISDNVDGQKLPLFQILQNYSHFETTQNNIEWLYALLNTVSKEASFYIREQVFEDVRKELYPHLPSRQTCLWVTSENLLSYWVNTISYPQKYIFKLELQGEIFCADSSWLNADTFSSVEYADRAKHYWAGEFVTEDKLEYLFSGNATVKEVTFIE